jgi:hypothetical protein
MAIEKLKGHKSPAFYHITADFIKQGRRKIRSKVHKLIKTLRKKEKFPEEWKESIFVRIYQKGDKTNCSIYKGISI